MKTIKCPICGQEWAHQSVNWLMKTRDKHMKTRHKEVEA